MAQKNPRPLHIPESEMAAITRQAIKKAGITFKQRPPFLFKTPEQATMFAAERQRIINLKALNKALTKVPTIEKSKLTKVKMLMEKLVDETKKLSAADLRKTNEELHLLIGRDNVLSLIHNFATIIVETRDKYGETVAKIN